MIAKIMAQKDLGVTGSYRCRCALYGPLNENRVKVLSRRIKSVKNHEWKVLVRQVKARHWIVDGGAER